MIILAVMISLSGYSQDLDSKTLTTEELNVIPYPQSVQIGDENAQISQLKIFVDKMDLANFGLYHHPIFAKADIVSRAPKRGDANVDFIIDTTYSVEKYKLSIETDRITIISSGLKGSYYALTTLAQVLQYDPLPLKMMVISDEPKFAYRGMHLDVARHFFSVAEVKKYIDFLAGYKFSYFHWHLTDDQGWRIQINKYPKLQTVAAYRPETLIGHYSDQPHQYDGKRYGGYYTQQEIKSIVKYAQDRNVEIIPEIEMPGHAQAAISAYPELGCTGLEISAATTWGVFDDVFCPKETTFKFLQDVIDEVIVLFPSKYIHIGGDECPKTAWKNSAFCQELIQSKGLKDEEGLQSYFIQRIEKYINSKGKKIIGWDEILEGGLAPNATVMSWRGVQGGIEAAKQHHDVIMTPGTHCYFDHYQSLRDDEPIAIGGYTPIEKVYEFNPIPNKLSEEFHKYILGGQANLWTEYITDFDHLTYMAFARGMAMSEALWGSNRDYSGFTKRFGVHQRLLTASGLRVANHLNDLNPLYKIESSKGSSIGFPINESNESIIIFKDGERVSEVVSDQYYFFEGSGDYSFVVAKDVAEAYRKKISYKAHKATKAKASLSIASSSTYSGYGAVSLHNGVLANDDKFSGKEWLGFDGGSPSVVLAFDQPTIISSIRTRFFKSEGQWIYLPKSVKIYASADGKVYKEVASTTEIASTTKTGNVAFNFQNLTTKYLKLAIENFGVIPSGAQGEGHGAWLFVDEIVVE